MIIIKKILRQNILSIRKSISKTKYDELSKTINKKLLNLLSNFDYKTIALYYPIKKEVNSLDLIKNQLLNQKEVYLPKILNNQMNFFKLSSMKELKKGAYNIPEPISLETKNEIDIYIIPGIAFSKTMYRLGYGGGFYDRYFSINKKTKLIAPCFELQLLEELPYEEHDITIDYIVTEKNILKGSLNL
ncbi:5-formyltetrahydrofolate cyclo-ligase [Tepiditoga spiralis]|uniref:5-formyltetrahydrofolate cyclo-ligase n=1 Tax=Tepiditoga spiralis TaxID=2108365 RepID=A0A7G1G808_9BACT|nr:5-formyltetrahydrofolate cyclo-ligase [Tepiditoga spiralis]BBE31344.1 5-formyltetrahydrofolate cyclo-ligase [Tepiditoga spiralis]